MTSRKKEAAKFFAGFETFQTISHGYFWLSGTTLPVFGFTETPTVHMWSAVVNAAIAIVLGLYAWRTPAHEIEGRHAAHPA